MLTAGGAEARPNAAATACLLLAAAVATRIGVALGARTTSAFATPVVVCAGLLGGPLVGAFAGAFVGLVETGSAWRRRATSGGLCALVGIAAGVLAAPSGAEPSQILWRSALAFAAAAALGLAGRALALLERRARLGPDFVRAGAGDALTLVVGAPLVALLALAYDESHAVALVGLGALVVSGALLAAAWRGQQRRLAAALGVAHRDALTGLLNRAGLETSLAAERARVLRGARPAGLFLIDLDHFKRVNDTYGHQAGDDVLVDLARRWTEQLRATDLVCRYGGEEFAILAPELGADRATELAERIRSLASAAPLQTRDGPLSLTVSVGGVLLDGSASAETALRRADEALYRAKRRRNVVELDLGHRVRLEAARLSRATA